MRTFRREEDYALYRSILAKSCARSGVEIWAYCFMPNHSHLIAVPETERALMRAIGDANQAYTRVFNRRERCTGHLWQGRFASYPMDEGHTIAGVRYIELNPVRAGLVMTPSDWAWSSARAHLLGVDDELVRVSPLLERRPDWRRLIGERLEPETLDVLRRHAGNGQPLGDEAFVREIERRTGRVLRVG